MNRTSRILFFFFLLTIKLSAVELGLELVFQPPHAEFLKGKKIGLITNQTAVNHALDTSMALFYHKQKALGFELKALFAPEHGIYGDLYADKEVAQSKTEEGIVVYSLYGATRRPTPQMLKEINLLIFDIQDLGCRSYTYVSTLFYVMEEAAKQKIPVLVLDRPNPINGLVVDGPMLEDEYRSFLGYANIPYTHGMTIGELASFFNEEYKVGCDLHVVWMKGYKRWMRFEDTQLHWIPTSPNIPEATTASFYPMTGLFGEIQRFVSIGIGYTLPFKVVGAPWINPDKFTSQLNRYKLPGVLFYPFRFRPVGSSFSGKPCKGVLIKITNSRTFLPVTTQYALMSALRELYPKELLASLRELKARPLSFFKACGTHAIYDILEKEEHPFTRLCEIHAKERQKFLLTRKKYLHIEY